MNAGALLAHYERVANAPDSTGRLRRFVLDLAVRGKLVRQYPTDEPASDLLKKIASERTRLVAAGELKREKPIPDVEPNEAPFECPRGWQWSRIRKVTSDRGQAIPEKEFTYIDVTAINKEAGRIENPVVVSPVDAPSRARKLVSRGDVLYSCVRPYLLNIAIVDRDLSPPPIASTAFAVLNGFGLVLPGYQWIVLRSPFFVECVEGKMRGQAYPAINDADFALLPFPLPPLAEQHRIVAKVDELMALCDRLEAARLQREATRDRLAAASLARLNTPARETFQADARFAIGTALPSLTTRPDQIKQLRQTILNLAVLGKLAQQDSSDEPTAVLLQRIADAVPRSGHQSSVEDGAAREDLVIGDFALPAGWEWIPLEGITDVGTGLTPSKSQPKYYEGGDIPWINSGATSAGIVHKAEHFVTSIAVKECRLKIYPAGSLIVALYGQGKTRGQVAELAINATVNQACAVIQWRPSFEALKGFVLLALQQQYELMRAQAEGGPQPNLNVGKIKRRPIALPPLAEQHRIVAKVDELMSLCDQLEASLTHGESTRSRLLNALLHEALHPSHDNVIYMDAARQRLREKREAVASRIVERMSRSKGLGRVRVVKALYFAEAHCRTALGGQWGRGDFGPYDHWILSFESKAASAGWLTRTEHPNPEGGTRIEYKPGPQLSAKARSAAQALGDQTEEFDRVLALLTDLDSEESEIVATLYAAWNDLLLEGKPVSDDIVITEFREHWGVSRKASFQPARLRVWLDWMRKNRLTPTGHGPSTRHQAELI